MDVDSLEIWMIAGLLVDEHGEGALGFARERAEQAFSHDDFMGHAIWRAVACAAATYLKSDRSGRKH